MLKNLVASHPLREQSRRQLMLALYRSGRHSEALAAYREACSALDELGLVPSPQLRDLEKAILRHDESLDAPLRAHSQTRAQKRGSSPSVTPAPNEPPLVGRAAELNVMLDALTEAIDRHAPLLIVSGEPGIGKTRLAQEFSDRATESGCVVAWGRCFEAEATAAYRPMVSVLRSILDCVPGDRLASFVGPPEAGAAVLLPELHSLADAIDPSLRISGDKRLLLFDSVVRLLAAVAEEAPLVLVIDDIHVADYSTLALVAHVVRYTPDDRILLVLTHRHTELAMSRQRSQWLDSVLGDRRFHHVQLSGLDPDEVRTLVISIAGSQPARLDPFAVAVQTGGNPLFVRELAAYDPPPDDGGSRLPETVISAIRGRLGKLDQTCQNVLQLVAMTPGGAPLEVLARATGGDLEQVVSAVEIGLRAGVLRERVELGTTVVALVHPVFRQAIEGQTSAARRSSLHLRLADAMERLELAGPDSWVGELADHAFAAGRSAGAERVARLCRLAGDQAVSRTAWDAGAVYYERALGAMSWTGERMAADRAEIALRCAEAFHAAGDSLGRQRAAEAAFADASSAREPALMARAALVHGGTRSTYGVASTHTMELLSQSLSALPPGPGDPLTPRVMSRLAQEHYHVGDYDLADHLSSDAVALARLTGDDGALAATMEGRIWALHRPDTLTERSALCEEMVMRAELADDKERLILALVWRSCAALELGNLEQVDADLTRLTALTTTVRVPSLLFRVMTMRATRAIMAGNYEDGMALAHETYRIGLSIEPDNATQTLAAQLLPMLREFDALKGVIADAEQMASSYPAAVGWRCALAFAYLEADLPDRARAVFDQLAQDGFHTIPRDLAWLLAHCYLAEVAAGLGDAARAEELYRLMLPYADRNGAVFDIASVGSVSHHLALLARTMGSLAQASAHFLAAIEFNDRTGQGPAAARSRYEYARLLQRTSESAAFESALSEALTAARRLSMQRIAAKAETLTSTERVHAPTH